MAQCRTVNTILIFFLILFHYSPSLADEGGNKPLNASCLSSRRFYVFSAAPCFEELMPVSAADEARLPFALDWVLHNRLLGHPCRTHDAFLANAVFVPTFGGSFDHQWRRTENRTFWASEDHSFKNCLSELDESLRADRRWQLTNGTDFFFVWSQTWGCCAGVLSQILQTSLHRSVVLSLEAAYEHGATPCTQSDAVGSIQPWPHSSSQKFADQCFRVKNPTSGDVGGGGTGTALRVFGIPYQLPPYSASFMIDMHQRALVSDRTRLIAALFALHGRGAGVRLALKRQCLSIADECLYMAKSSSSSTDDVLLTSTFALVPTGDTPSRSMVWKAIRAGAIPVFFQSCTHGFWKDAYPFHLDPVHEFGAGTWAVLLNSTKTMMNDTHIRDELKLIPNSKLALMRARCLFLSQRGSYLLKDDGAHIYDATDVIVDTMTMQLAF